MKICDTFSNIFGTLTQIYEFNVSYSYANLSVLTVVSNVNIWKHHSARAFTLPSSFMGEVNILFSLCFVTICRDIFSKSTSEKYVKTDVLLKCTITFYYK